MSEEYDENFKELTNESVPFDKSHSKPLNIPSVEELLLILKNKNLKKEK